MKETDKDRKLSVYKKTQNKILRINNGLLQNFNECKFATSHCNFC